MDRRFFRSLRSGLAVLAFIALFLIFFTAIAEMRSGSSEKGRIQLEEAVRMTAVACYASEGIYPPDVDYMAEHYGLRVDDDHYTVFYDIFASNIMPEITVVEK